jgi:hypothetical protein
MNMKDLSQSEMGRWMDAVPQVVYDVVISPETQRTVEQLGQQYKLHVDVVGILYKLTCYMLVGYLKPEEASIELRKVGVSDTEVRTIMSDLNQRIFVPLHNVQVRKPQPQQTTNVTSQSAKPTLQMPPPQPTTHGPTPIMQMPSMYTPPPQSPRYPHQQTPEPAITFTRPLNKPAAPAPAPAPSKPQAPSGPQISDAEHLLEDREEPHIEFRHETPKESAPTPMPSIPNADRNMPPPNLPGATPTPPPQVSQPEPKIVPPSPSRPYAADPYREPLE